MELVRRFCKYVWTRAPSQTLFPSRDNPLSGDYRQCPSCCLLFTNETTYSEHWCWGSRKLIVVVLALLVLLWQIDTSTDLQILEQAYQSIDAPRYLTDLLVDVTVSKDGSAGERYSKASRLCKNLTSNIAILTDQAEYFDRQTARMVTLIDTANKFLNIPDKPASMYEPIFLDEYDHRVFGKGNKTHQRLTDIKKHRQLAGLLIERARKRLHNVLSRFPPMENITFHFPLQLVTCNCNTENKSDLHHFNIDTETLLSMFRFYEDINDRARSSINDLCFRIYERKEYIEKDLSFLLKRIKPFSDLHKYYMEQRQNRELKALLLAQNYLRIYGSFYLTCFKYMVYVASILHIWRVIGLWIYTQVYRIIMNQKWVWKSRTATTVVIWLAVKIDSIMKANESGWKVLTDLNKQFATVLYKIVPGTSEYVNVDTRLTFLEFTNITSQESKIIKTVKNRAKQHISYQKKNRYDESLGLSLDKQDENNNMKALIEVKYLQTILKNTRSYYYLTAFSHWMQKEIEIFETDKKQRLEFYENNSQVTKELSISCIHSFTETSLKEVVTLFENVMSFNATNGVNKYQLTYYEDEEEEANKLEEDNIVLHEMILSLTNALLHISPRQFQKIQQQKIFEYSDQYKQAWSLTNFVSEYEETSDDSIESSEVIIRSTIIKLSAAVKGLIHDHVFQRYDWKRLIIGDIERLVTMLHSLENLGRDFLSIELQWQDLLKIVMYHSALFFNNIKAARKCLNIFDSDNLVRICHYRSLLIDIRDSLNQYTQKRSLLNGDEDAQLHFRLPNATDVQSECIASSTEPWWWIWKANKAPADVDNTSQSKSSGADEETKEKTKTDSQYLRELPPTDTFKNGGVKFQAIYATVEVGTHHLICLLTAPMGILLSSQLDDTWEYKAKDECDESPGADDTILHTKLRRGTSYHARKFIYCALTDEWMYSNTIISIDDQIDIETNEQGKQRDVIRVSLRENNQPHVLKINREPKLHHVQIYLSDIRAHQISRYYVDLFTEMTKDRYVRLRMLDAIHIEILEEANGMKVLDYGNAELSMEGYKFVKFSNNTGRVNEKLHTDLREIATAFSHFTHHHSQGALMVVDLQGWIRITNDDVEIMLTDPAINCPDAQLGFFGFNNWGQAGFDKFWTGQHRKCNKYCKELRLMRPEKYSLAAVFASLFRRKRSIRPLFQSKKPM